MGYARRNEVSRRQCQPFKARNKASGLLSTKAKRIKRATEREKERERAKARGIEHYGVKYMWANFEGTSCGR